MSLQSKKKFKIAHTLEQLEDDLILTLKDRSILKDNKQIDQDDDMFENEQVQNLNRMKHNSQLRKRIKQLSDVSTSHLQTKYQGKGGILPHYDDHSYKNAQIEVQQNGLIKTKKVKSALKTVQSDFLAPSQSNKLTKLGSQYNQIKIKKGFNKRSQPNKSNSTSLLSFLNDTAEDSIIEDSFKKDTTQAIDDALDSMRKKRILEYNAKRQVQSVDISSIIGLNQEEQIFNKAMQKGRKQNKNVLDMIKQQQKSDIQDQQNAKKNTVEINLNPISYKGDDKKYVRKDIDISGIKSGTTSAMFIKLPSQRLSQKPTQALPESFKQISPQQLAKMKEQISFLQDKALGTGLSGALSYLRENSLINNQEEVGRSTDKSIHINDKDDRVRLEYRNASGKLMKPKEAFRYLCATFHGEGPGKNKIQKRRKKELEELRMKERSNTDGQFMNLLAQHQKKNNQAHMVVDFGKK